MGKHHVSRIQKIPAPLFYKLYHSVPKFDSKDAYIKNYTSVFSKDYIDTHKLGIRPDTFLKVLFKTYELARLSVSDLIKASQLTRAAFGYKYCIPIRTLEKWCKDDTSPDYLRLFIIKDIGLFQYPQYVHIGE